MKILFTGFNGYNNPSKVIVVRTNHDKLLFNNSYKEIDNQLVDINVEDYDLIIMLGLRSNLKRSIRLEINSMVNDELLATNLNYCNVKRYFNDNDISCIVNDNQQIIYAIMLIIKFYKKIKILFLFMFLN